MYLFSSRKSLFWFANKQTENLKVTLESKTPLGVQQKLEQQMSVLFAVRFLSRVARYFPFLMVKILTKSIKNGWF